MQKKEQLIQYRKNIEIKADCLLQKLLPEENDWVKDVLVVAAGCFPSEKSVTKILTSANTHFTLAEPDKNATDFFCEQYVGKNFSIESIDIKTFLQTTDKKFDLIYFEHPETMTIPLVLGQLGVKTLKRVTSFRESFAYLANILKERSIIIASCMSKHECDQLKSLLHYSTPMHIKVFSSLKTIFYGGPYSSGLVASTCLPAKCRAKRVNLLDLLKIKKKVGTLRFTHPTFMRRGIIHSNRALCTFLFLGIFFYIFYCSQFPDPDHALQRLIMIILIAAQLYLHQPGVRGYFHKFFLFALQIALYF